MTQTASKSRAIWPHNGEHPDGAKLVELTNFEGLAR